MTDSAFGNDADPPLDEVRFARDLGELRPLLRSYVLSIFPHPDRCEDIVQETLIFAWDRRDDFTPGTNLKAWLFKAGYFKTLSFRRDCQRDKIVTFSEDVLQRLAGAAEEAFEEPHTRLRAMRKCLAELGTDDISLLKFRYIDRGSLTERANELRVPPNRLQKTISRIRLALRHCIEKHLPNP